MKTDIVTPTVATAAIVTVVTLTTTKTTNNHNNNHQQNINNIINQSNSNNPKAMAFDMYPSISGKQQDPVREVVMKYIDYFLPDASGTSAVAIDNKIEQAMDLVKSHLMIAVREEVEVLKERISELMDKINKLEIENTVLKANMSQETLQQLQLQLQIANSNAPAAVAAPPVTPAIQAAPTVSATGTVVENNLVVGGDVATVAAAVAPAVVGLTSNGTTVAAAAASPAPVTVTAQAAAATTVPATVTGVAQGTAQSTVTAPAGDSANTTNGPMSS